MGSDVCVGSGYKRDAVVLDKSKCLSIPEQPENPNPNPVWFAFHVPTLVMIPVYSCSSFVHSFIRANP